MKIKLACRRGGIGQIQVPMPLNSINLIVSSNALKENGFLFAMFYKLKDDAEVITGAASP